VYRSRPNRDDHHGWDAAADSIENDEDLDQEDLAEDGDNATCRDVINGGKAKTSPKMGTTRLAAESLAKARYGTGGAGARILPTT
jgi:hypothetical protein